MRPIAGIAPTPSAATLAAKNFRRAGFARDGWQQRQVRKNLAAELALIPSSRFCCGASLALVPAPFQTPRISPFPGEPHESPQTRDRPYGGRAIRAGVDNRFDSAAATHRRGPTLARDSARRAKPTARRTARRQAFLNLCSAESA